MSDLLPNIKSLAGKTQASTPKDDKPAKSSAWASYNLRALGVFRYTLALLLISVKLGLFAYLSVNPLAATSWWLVFLPAYVVELGLVAIAALALMIAVVALLVYVLYLGVMLYIVRPIRQRRSARRFADRLADRLNHITRERRRPSPTEQPTSGDERAGEATIRELMNQLRKTQTPEDNK